MFLYLQSGAVLDKTNFSKNVWEPRRTETGIASIAGRSPAFCEYYLIIRIFQIIIFIWKGKISSFPEISSYYFYSDTIFISNSKSHRLSFENL